MIIITRTSIFNISEINLWLPWVESKRIPWANFPVLFTSVDAFAINENNKIWLKFYLVGNEISRSADLIATVDPAFLQRHSMEKGLVFDAMGSFSLVHIGIGTSVTAERRQAAQSVGNKKVI